MTIGILTFHASHNYGSMLQTYALQTALRKMGHDCLIINMRIKAQKELYYHPLSKLNKRLLSSLCHPLRLIQCVKKWYLFEDFMQKQFRLTQECSKIKDVCRIIDDHHFDAIITGGDQIWNMNAQDFSIAYYLPFDAPGVRKIAYSPSFGSGENFISENYSKCIRSLLQNYHYLSVRDEPASLFISSLFQKEIPTIPDPAFLLSKEDYLPLFSQSPIIKGKYILYYAPQYNKTYEQIASNYARMSGLPIYVTNGKTCKQCVMKTYMSVGPSEFLNILMNAEIVCGKSFHMVVFSLIFEKQFFAITGKKDARICGLLSQLGLKDHGISPTSDGTDIELKPIYWPFVRTALSQLRAKGVEYLEKALNEPIK